MHNVASNGTAQAEYAILRGRICGVTGRLPYWERRKTGRTFPRACRSPLRKSSRRCAVRRRGNLWPPIPGTRRKTWLFRCPAPLSTLLTAHALPLVCAFNRGSECGKERPSLVRAVPPHLQHR
ncbi:unnamed protein product [Rangifer tarandus platyrhynchus]|uniref:Uncharacterized protein n=1 Tax=Rangifer tarandus platyrhynchus TaxID=3082113 RepID=A0ABN8XJG3_RANTA|nr:unnamed protein product [Rangifer tarandus platyrhynchus]